MSTKHRLDGEGRVVCGATPREDGANVTSDISLVNCGSGCLAIYPPPFGYIVSDERSLEILKAAKPRDVVLQFALGGGTGTTVLDYRPVQGPRTKEMSS